MRIVAAVPCYNEAPHVTEVLDAIAGHVDHLVVIDDGSTDGTTELLRRWAQGRPDATLLGFPENRGSASALYAGLRLVAGRVAIGELDPDDIVLTIDADGQHDPRYIPELVARLESGEADVVWARRDLRTYPPHKRLGNWFMSRFASLLSGRRFFDVECGFRAFRARDVERVLPLVRSRRYGHCQELGVLFSLMGCRLDNQTVNVAVPVYRSRTRVIDVVRNAQAGAGAWWRFWNWTGLPEPPKPRRTRLLQWTAALGPVLVLLALLIGMGVRTIYLGADSANNYAHVWYVYESLVTSHVLPLRIPLLDSGSGLTFPYGLAPWTVGALLYGFLRDRAVTLLMVVAVSALVGTVYRTRLRRDLVLTGIFVANPFFLNGILTFQFSFMWSALFFFLWVVAVERRWWVPATGLLWLTVSTHPIMGAASVGAYGLWRWRAHREERRPLAVMAAVAGAAAVPLYLYIFGTPALSQDSLWSIATETVQTVAGRGTIVALPFLLAAMPRLARSHALRLVAVGLLAATLATIAEQDYLGLFHNGRDVYAAYFTSPQFHPGAVYRVLEPNNQEQGAYYVMRHGGVLAQEFFSQAQFRRSFRYAQYRAFLNLHRVDYVVFNEGYQKEFHTNELDLLRSLCAEGLARVVYRDPGGRFVVYDVRAAGAAGVTPVLY